MATTDTDYVQISLRSNKKHHFTGEKVVVHRRTGFVLFSGIVKVVCKGRGVDGDGLWDKVLPKMTATKYMFKKNNLFCSIIALRIVLDNYKDSCKDTLGAFADDGFQQLAEDLKVVLDGRRLPIKVKKEEDDTFADQPAFHIPTEYGLLLNAREMNLAENEKTLTARHELLETREKVVSAREKTMNEREQFYTQNEAEFFNKVVQYKKDRDVLDLRSKALDKKQKELDERSNDLQQFMDQTLSLAKQFSGSSSSKKKTPSKVHFNLPSSKRSSTPSSPSTSKDSAVKALLMVKKVCVLCVSYVL